MAQNLGFARGGTSSWADEDDVDFQPLPVVPKVAPTEAPQPIEEEEIQHHEQQHDEPRRGGYGDRYDDRHDDRRGGYGDRRGSYEERRREPREERPKNAVPDVGPWKLFVGNLPFRLSEDELAEFIGPQGVKDIRFPRDFENRPKGFAYVEFDKKEQLVQALQLDGRNLDGRQVKLDVALDRERERKPRDNGWFDKRTDRPSNDRPSNDRRERNDTPRERQRLTLLPRTSSSEKKDSDAHKPSIFGEAKPRDEAAYLERKKALNLERKAKAKADKEAKAKAKVDKEAKAKADKEAKAKAKEEKETKPKTKAEASVPTRKGSHDDGFRGGRGRGRGDRRTAEGGRGRGAPVKENAPPRKSEPRPKRTEPPTTKISAPAPAKTANVFGLLDDSDSDSD